MSKTKLDVDYYLMDTEDELMVAIRTSDGTELTPQDILDSAIHVAEMIYGGGVKSITFEDIKNNTGIH